MNLFVVDARTVVALTAATLLPYLPVVFAVLPIQDVVRLVLKTIT